jgi:hypothetical protein
MARQLREKLAAITLLPKRLWFWLIDDIISSGSIWVSRIWHQIEAETLEVATAIWIVDH